MYKHRYNTKGSANIGRFAELLFEHLATSRGWWVRKATKNQDYLEHWDYLLKKKKLEYHIEVKGMKRLNRQVNQDDKMICIELQGNSGYPGWLYGKASHIAFLMREGFVLVERKLLIQKVTSIIDIDGEITQSIRNKQSHIIYRRVQFGHKDKIVYITKEELLSVPHKLWEIEDV